MKNPLVVCMGIGEYDNDVNWSLNVQNDYARLETTFNKIYGFSFLYMKDNDEFELITRNSTSPIDKRPYKKHWTADEISDFTDIVKAAVSEYDFDGLIYCISSHGDTGRRIYASDGEEYCLTFVLDMFTNKKCPQLRNKPKIYIIDACRGGSKNYWHSNSMFSTTTNTTTIVTTNTAPNATQQNNSNGNNHKSDVDTVTVLPGQFYFDRAYEMVVYAVPEGYSTPEKEGGLLISSVAQALCEHVEIAQRNFRDLLNIARKITNKQQGFGEYKCRAAVFPLFEIVDRMPCRIGIQEAK